MTKTLKDSYTKYKETADNIIPYKIYMEIALRYNKFLIEKCLEGHEVILPSRLGCLSVVGRQHNIKVDQNGKVLNQAPDWVKTKKLWDSNPEAKAKKQLVYHTNNHTEGYRYKWNWSKSSVIVENKTLYSLIMSRTNKRTLHKEILKGTQFITK